VLPVIIALVVGSLIGVARRPLGARAVRPPVRRLELLLVGAGLQLVALGLSGDLAPIVSALAIVALLVVVAGNLHLTGMLVIGVGLLVNLAGVSLNGGMPVRAEALVQAGLAEPEEVASLELRGPRHLESPSDIAPILGDVLALPALRAVLSFGDLIVLVGLTDLLAQLTRRRRRRWSRAERTDYDAARTTQANVVQVWGAAPSPAPVSGSQCSDQPDVRAPASIDLRISAPTAEPSGPERVAASHSR
jgi:hypothetical protein